MIQSVLDTSTEADVAVFVDDDQREVYAGTDSRAQVVVGKRRGQCASLNALQNVHPGYLAYGAATDDCEFVTPSWDRWVIQARESFAGNVGAIAPRCEMDQRMDFPWFTDRWIKVAGGFCPVGTQHEYWDLALELVAEQVAIAYAKPGECDIVHHSEPATDLTDHPDMLPTESAIWMLKNCQDGRFACAWLAHNRRQLIQLLRLAARG
jgi:hypothetical protein